MCIRDSDWTVKLDKYALVNLSNSVYTARHLTDASWENFMTLGLLGVDNMAYMVDPNSKNKNNVTAVSYTHLQLMCPLGKSFCKIMIEDMVFSFPSIWIILSVYELSLIHI